MEDYQEQNEDKAESRLESALSLGVFLAYNVIVWGALFTPLEPNIFPNHPTGSLLYCLNAVSNVASILWHIILVPVIGVIILFNLIFH